MIRKIQQHFSAFLAGILLVFLVVTALITEGYYGGADNISHFLISHYAFRHPALFLDSWGRPLYTLLSAPFAQFGLAGARMLNVLLAWGTGWLAFRAARKLGIRNAPAAMVFILFTPLFFVMIPTALTEILFGFLLLLGAFLSLEKRYIPAAVAWSLLPFARTEGYVLLPFLLPVFLFRRQYRAIPFLAAGTILLSLAGGLYYRDLFWLINRFPYPVNYTHPIYHQTGSLWHFAVYAPAMLGYPLLVLFVAGIAGMVAGLFSHHPENRSNARMILHLALLPFLAYFALHSVLFWKAMGGSMGLERVMAAVLPLAALVALKGMDDLFRLFRIPDKLTTAAAVVVSGLVVAMPFVIFTFPTLLTPEEETVRRAAAWLKESPWKDRPVYYTDQNVPYYLGADPWVKNPATCVLFGDSKYLDTIPAGSVLVWDAHFGANESKIPLDSLLQYPGQKMLACFRPLKPWLTFGGGWYEGCLITSILPRGQTADNYAIYDSLSESIDLDGSDTLLYLNTFENSGDA
ncbi:MAG TPA: hypothetical protein PKG48_07330, partial [Bacteroidales bacterium]|nr:hypothetical protein [Bacteroidales bacterium]